MEGRMAGDKLLERTMRRELLFDRRALEDMMEDLSCSILGYLTQGIINTDPSYHLDADPSTAAQHMVQTSSALHAGLHAITRILPTSTAATSTDGLVDSCLVDFITSFVDYLSMVTTRPSATIGMLPVHTRVQLVSILVQCVRIVAGRLRPTAIRTLGGTSDKQAAAAALVSPSTAADGAVLLTGLDAVTSFLLKQQQQQSSNRTCMLLLLDDDNDDTRRRVDLFCTLHECIMILNGSISCMLQHHHNIIAPSLGDHRDAMGRTIKSGGKQHSYPQPTTSKRVAAHSFAAPSIADHRSTTIHTNESSRDDDHPHRKHHHHLHHHRSSSSELEAPYRGTMVLYFLYENRRFLDSLRRFVGSVLVFQSHCSSSSSSSSCGIPLKHGILSSAASIERLLLSVANSVSGGVVSLSHFSSMLLVTNMINLTSLKDAYPPHLLLLSAVDFISSMQGIVLQCVETARCEVSYDVSSKSCL